MSQGTSIRSASMYWQLAQHLYDAINHYRNSPKELEELEDILDEVKELLDDQCEGIGMDLWLWIGLIGEEPNMERDYRQDISEQVREHQTELAEKTS